MEAHPVPKNVLTVEFKLFGSLSVRQFMKILVASLVGFGLFASPIPKLISIPLIVVVVLLGIGAALIPNFEPRAFTFIRSIFISPRYVWRKKANAPDVLKEKQPDQAKAKKAAQARSSTSSEANSLSIDDLLRARSNYQQNPNSKAITELESPNFDRVYNQNFAAPRANPQPAVPVPSVKEPAVNTPPTAGRQVSNIDLAEKQKQIDVLQSQMLQLQEKLGDVKYVDSQNQIKQEISAIYSQLQALTGVHPILKAQQQQIQDQAKQKPIFGLVTDSRGQHIESVEITLLNSQHQEIAKTGSAVDGRFQLSGIDLPLGDYLIKLSHPQFKFSEYHIRLDGEHLPAYKFRAL